MKKKDKNKGFTILEVALVIVFIGILALSAAPNLVSLRQETLMARRDGTVAAIQSGLQIYLAYQYASTQYATYPKTLDEASDGTCIERAQPDEECFSTVLKKGMTSDWTRYFGGLLYRHNDTNTWYWYRSGVGFFMCIANCWQ